MPIPPVDQARSFRDNPRHFPRKLFIRLYRPWQTALPSKALPHTPESLLVQAQEKLGDGVLLMPFLNGFHRLFPKARIDVLCSRHNRYLFKALPFVADTFTYRTGSRTLRNILRQHHYDLFYNPKDHPSITAYRLARWVRAEVKVCLSQPSYLRYYHRALENRDGVHVIEKNAELLRHYCLKFPVSNYFPPVPDLNGTDFPDPVIALNLSAGGHYRHWPEQNWARLVQGIVGAWSEMKLAIFALEQDRKTAEHLKERYGDRVVHPLESPDLLAAAAILRHCRLLVSPDTALVHVAAAVDTPVIGLYSGDQRNRQRYAPYGVRAKILSARGLSLGTIEPETVLEALEQLNQEIDLDHTRLADHLKEEN